MDEISLLLGLYFLTTCSGSFLFWMLDQYVSREENRNWIARKFDLDEASMDSWKLFLSVTWASLGWFSVSISFTLFNKYFFQYWNGGFDYPILLTTLHMGLKVVVTRWWIYFNGDEVPPLDLWANLKIVIPIGIFTGADIVLSNTSILYIPLSLYTALKTVVPALVFFFSVMIGLEKFKWPTFISIFFVAFGLVIAVQFSTDASTLGIVLILLACVSSALRWTLLQLLIKIDNASSNVMVAIYRFAPTSTLFLLPIALAVEMPRFLKSHFASSALLTSEAIGIGCFGAILSIVLIGFEIFILRITSSVTLGILGQAKEIAQIALSMLIYKETMTVRTAIGLTISLIAANFYKVIKQGESDEGDEDGDGSGGSGKKEGFGNSGQSGHGLLHEKGRFGSTYDLDEDHDDTSVTL